eukprot:GHVQ01014981.1.p1 GENE.GHVQ01014981.1~~GHVQ01014981.1.p1  ORF type:complete len:1191 (+),score=239.16 GHVQ01014981.1:722-4294(+)
MGSNERGGNERWEEACFAGGGDGVRSVAFPGVTEEGVGGEGVLEDRRACGMVEVGYGGGGRSGLLRSPDCYVAEWLTSCIEYIISNRSVDYHSVGIACDPNPCVAASSALSSDASASRQRSTVSSASSESNGASVVLPACPIRLRDMTHIDCVTNGDGSRSFSFSPSSLSSTSSLSPSSLSSPSYTSCNQSLLVGSCALNSGGAADNVMSQSSELFGLNTACVPCVRNLVYSLLELPMIPLTSSATCTAAAANMSAATASSIRESPTAAAVPLSIADSQPLSCLLRSTGICGSWTLHVYVLLRLPNRFIATAADTASGTPCEPSSSSPSQTSIGASDGHQPAPPTSTTSYKHEYVHQYDDPGTYFVLEHWRFTYSSSTANKRHPSSTTVHHHSSPHPLVPSLPDPSTGLSPTIMPDSANDCRMDKTVLPAERKKMSRVHLLAARVQSPPLLPTISSAQLLYRQLATALRAFVCEVALLPTQSYLQAFKLKPMNLNALVPQPSSGSPLLCPCYPNWLSSCPLSASASLNTTPFFHSMPAGSSASPFCTVDRHCDTMLPAYAKVHGTSFPSTPESNCILSGQAPPSYTTKKRCDYYNPSISVFPSLPPLHDLLPSIHIRLSVTHSDYTEPLSHPVPCPTHSQQKTHSTTTVSPTLSPQRTSVCSGYVPVLGLSSLPCSLLHSNAIYAPHHVLPFSSETNKWSVLGVGTDQSCCGSTHRSKDIAGGAGREEATVGWIPGGSEKGGESAVKSGVGGGWMSPFGDCSWWNERDITTVKSPCLMGVLKVSVGHRNDLGIVSSGIASNVAPVSVVQIPSFGSSCPCSGASATDCFGSSLMERTSSSSSSPNASNKQRPAEGGALHRLRVERLMKCLGSVTTTRSITALSQAVLRSIDRCRKVYALHYENGCNEESCKQCLLHIDRMSVTASPYNTGPCTGGCCLFSPKHICMICDEARDMLLRSCVFPTSNCVGWCGNTNASNNAENEQTCTNPLCRVFRNRTATVRQEEREGLEHNEIVDFSLYMKESHVVVYNNNTAGRVMVGGGAATADHCADYDSSSNILEGVEQSLCVKTSRTEGTSGEKHSEETSSMPIRATDDETAIAEATPKRQENTLTGKGEGKQEVDTSKSIEGEGGEKEVGDIVKMLGSAVSKGLSDVPSFGGSAREDMTSLALRMRDFQVASSPDASTDQTINRE